MRCTQCKEEEKRIYSWWERTRYDIYDFFNKHVFSDEYQELKNAKYTEGFCDGYAKGSKVTVDSFIDKMKMMQ